MSVSFPYLLPSTSSMTNELVYKCVCVCVFAVWCFNRLLYSFLFPPSCVSCQYARNVEMLDLSNIEEIFFLIENKKEKSCLRYSTPPCEYKRDPVGDRQTPMST